jgi:hypothetical protein
MTERVIYIGTPSSVRHQKEWEALFRYCLNESEEYESFEHMLQRLKDKEKTC